MNIFIDPAYPVYYENRLFDEHDTFLNRDGSLVPFIRFKSYLEEQGHTVNTADYLHQSEDPDIVGEYYSFGLLDHIDTLLQKKHIRLKAFVISEPPVVAPHLYQNLARLTELFESVYVHNVVGDGYSLRGVATYKLKKWYWPQPYADVILPLWQSHERKRRVVVINGNHKPRSKTRELYSKRMEVMAALARVDMVDLYGRDWQKWYSRESMWVPYWRYRHTVLSIYKGACDSKPEVLSQYDFCLCFENMQMMGYVTEKIFDCLYAGTIPIYLGADDIEEWIPKTVYIDFRQFSDVQSLCHRLQQMTAQEILAYKEAGRAFLSTEAGMRYYHAMNQLVGDVL